MVRRGPNTGNTRPAKRQEALASVCQLHKMRTTMVQYHVRFERRKFHPGLSSVVHLRHLKPDVSESGICCRAQSR